jgi:hypothetical protein
LATTASIFALRRLSATPPDFETAPQQCLTDAWGAFNAGDYERAIEHSDRCIDEFDDEAMRTQQRLRSEYEAPPPVDRVSAADRERILRQGVLNDVATALFVKGRSAEHLYDAGGAERESYRRQAEQAYAAACRYDYGRAWDPGGFFWSPCESASDRLPLD